ncbi:hypothetical protein ACLRGI_03655 [Paenarthrobacter nitroguajacolicus]|uniref:hypothetical protein n=1 Tax=Paenarthrobacter nitroguajacolicus TaxID=211146 RepID=UPI003AEDD404
MTIDLRGVLDPAPTKHIGTSGYIEVALTEMTHEVDVGGHAVHLSIASGNTAMSSTEGGTFVGLITVLATADDDTQIDEVAQAMMTAATRLSDAIRSRQPNVGLVGQPPEFVSFAVRKEGGTWGSYNYWPPTRPWYVNDVLETDYVVSALKDDLGLTDRLLAQAAFWSFHAEGSDPQTAVLLAAIACESHAKSTFHAIFESRNDGLLGDVLFGKIPPSTFSSSDLYHRVAIAIVGHSLKDIEPATYKGLVRLFELRNKVAHTGRLEPGLDAAESLRLAQASVRDAYAAVAWLRAITV